jgi:class 3 adenylate cyclase
MPEERRIVTILFADVTGSTELGESLDPEDVRALLGRYYAIAKEVVAAHGGTIEKFIGDAVMAVFGLPQAHGDDVLRALSAALELRDRVRAEPALGERVPVRLGVSTGEVVATRDTSGGDFLITGDAVNVAARLQQAAEPWAILCTERAVHAAGAAFTFGPASAIAAKGKRTPIVAATLVGRGDIRTPARIPLVGRETDLAHLELIARRTLTERRPFLLSLIAPAGTGKTRILEEFLDRLPRLSPDATVAVGQCLPYGQRLTYWPLRAVLFRLAAIEEEDEPPAIRKAIRIWLTGLGIKDAEKTADLLAATVGAGESEITDRTALLGAWRSAIEAAARRAPLVLVFEDLHWSSDSFLDLVEFVMQPRGDAAILMIALARPEILDRRPAWGGGRRNYVSMSLEPLSDAETGALVGHLLNVDAPEIIARIVARAEGNPFYAEELVRSVVERAAMPADAASVERALATLPDTVQATVLARIDLLSPDERRVLQLGAIFGRAFHEAGIAAIAPELAPTLERTVEQLLSKDLIRAEGAEGVAFRHILIREVAYYTLTRGERAQFHAAAGGWLERNAAGRGDALAELIAWHYREAVTLTGTLGRTAAQDSIRHKAVHWLARAADAAAAGAATFETVRHLRGAIDLADEDSLPGLYERLGDVSAVAGISEDAYLQALRLCREQGRPAPQRLRLLANLLTLLTRFQGAVSRRPSDEDMKQLLSEGETLLSEVDDERTVARFLIAKGFLPFWIGARTPPSSSEIAEAEAHAFRGLEIAARLRDAGLQSVALDALSSCAIRRRAWRQSHEFSRRRLAFGERLDLVERMDAYSVAAWAGCQLGDLDDAIDTSAAGLALLQPGQVPAQALHVAAWQIYALTLRGRWDEALAAGEVAFRLWNESNRFSAGFAVRGFVAALDVARGRRDDRLIERYREVADEIFRQLAPDAYFALPFKPLLTGALAAFPAAVARFQSHPSVEFHERALSFCSDQSYPLAHEVTKAIIAFAEPLGLRVLEAQARRALGIRACHAEELARALAIFERIGAAPYAARARCERALLIDDEQEFAAGMRALEGIGDVDQLERFDQARRRTGGAC